VRVLRYFIRRYFPQTALVVFCLVVGGALDGIGLTAMLPVAQIALGEAADAPGSPSKDSSTLSETVYGVLDAVGIEPSLATLLPIIVILYSLKAVAALFANRQVGYTVARIATDLRLEMLQALMAARWAHFTRLRAGSAANALATEAQRASTSYENMSRVCGQLVEGSIYFALAFTISVPITIGASIAALVSVGGLHKLVQMASRAGHKQTKYLKSLLAQVTDNLQAVKLLKATGRESLVEPLLESDTAQLNVALRRRVFSREALRAVQEPVLVTSLCVMLFVLVFLETPAAEIVLLGLLFARTTDCANKLQRRYQEAIGDASALWSIREMIDAAVANVEAMPTGAAPTLEKGVDVREVPRRPRSKRASTSGRSGSTWTAAACSTACPSRYRPERSPRCWALRARARRPPQI